jgi:RHS repeat-associated protein
LHSDIAVDAFGYALGYYWESGASTNKDYIPINAAAQSLYNDVDALTITTDNLYNGNIKEMSTALSKGNGTGLPTSMDLIYNQYHYDQLNRLKSSNSFTGNSTSSYAALSNTTEFQNTFTYDADGNIQRQLRNGNNNSGLSMDSLKYHYYKSTSGTYTVNADGSVPVDATDKLAYVDDGGTPGNYSDDLEGQLAGNYSYDAIGNLTGDVSEEIATIDWSVYGKIKSVSRSSGSVKKDINFIYDAMGNRICKISKDRDAITGVKTQDNWTYTYYVRDAQGNVMATYNRTYKDNALHTQVTDDLKLSETDLYGSTRLGLLDRTAENIHSSSTYNYIGFNGDNSFHITSGVSSAALTSLNVSTPTRQLGYKAYELVNHLGNVLVTVSDRKLLQQNGTTIDYYLADVRSTSDYSVFGAPMEGRNYSSTSYRYGFNGKEKIDEMHGNSGDEYDFGARIYDARLGRFLSTDPRQREYAWQTPYAYCRNRPISTVDVNGEGDPKGGSGFISMQKSDIASSTTSGITSPQPTAPTVKPATTKAVQTFTANHQAPASASASTPAPVTSAPATPVVTINTSLTSSATNTSGVVTSTAVPAAPVPIPIAISNANSNLPPITGPVNDQTSLNPATTGQNLLGNTYAGPTNPQTFGGQPDYSFVPINPADSPAIGHDRTYDNLKVKGGGGLFLDPRAIGGDITFVNQEMAIATNSSYNIGVRCSAAVLGIGLGACAGPKMLVMFNPDYYVQVVAWSTVSRQGVTNTPSPSVSKPNN